MSASERAYLPPHDVEAEEAVLGSLLIDPLALHQVAPFLDAVDFYVQKNGWVYQAALALRERGEPLDFVTLCNALEAHGQLNEVGGAAYLTSLINTVPSALHAEAYARLVREAAVRRRVLAFASQAAGLAYDLDLNLEDLLDQVEAALFQIRGRIAFQERLHSLGDVLDQVYETLEAASRKGVAPGVSTGFPDLDRLLGGLRGGNLALVASRPGVGKTSLLLGLAVSALRAGVPAALFSMEMSGEEIGHRLLAMEAGLDVLRLQMGQVGDDEWPTLVQGVAELSELPLWVDDTPHLTTADLRAKARRLYAEHGLGLLLLDYVQLAHTTRRYDSRYQEIGAITRELKELAQELKIPVVAASQVSRAVEQRADKRPTLADLRESGNQEADADVVLFIYREGTPGPEAAEIIVAKQRNGPTGTVHVLWQPHRVRFVPLAHTKPTEE